MFPKETAMKARGLLLLLLALCSCTHTTRALDILGGHALSSSSGEEFAEHLSGHYDRQLAAGSVEVCIEGTTKIYYFEVTIRLVPDEATVDICLLADQVLLGHDINLLLLDYGIGAAGADDDAVFLAGVCPLPSTSAAISERRMLGWWGGYVWKGGGGCRGCFGDNRDYRSMLRGLQELGSIRGLAQVKWFSEQYAQELENTLENAIKQEIAPKHVDCLGDNPQHIEVIINEIRLKDLELGCDDGNVIETLQSLSLSDEPLRDRNCDKCSSVDFSTKNKKHMMDMKRVRGLKGVKDDHEDKDDHDDKEDKGDKTDKEDNDDNEVYEDQTKEEVKKGDYVSDEWKVEHGFTVTASGGYTPGFKARIFDTGDNSCVSEEKGTLDFGSPNKNCQNGGLGQGEGGAQGQSGENCEPVGSK
jgi:hypothetical protein